MSEHVFTTFTKQSPVGIVSFVAVPENLAGDLRDQFEEVLLSAERTLNEAYSDKTRIEKATIFLTNFDDMMTVHQVWDAWVPPGVHISRTCVRSDLSTEHQLVQVAFLAEASPWASVAHSVTNLFG